MTARRAARSRTKTRPVGPRGHSEGQGPPSDEGARAGVASVTFSAGVEGRRPVVLVVDDSETVQAVIGAGLASTCTTLVALDGGSGLAIARDHAPDVAIIDLTLPDIAGDALIAAFRAHRVLRAIPILVVTADDDPVRMVRILENGADDFLRKPFWIPELRVRVQHLLTTRRVRDVLIAAVDERDGDLLSLADELAHEKRALERALAERESARARAERASQAKSNFLRMMSHELKTPIAALDLQVQLLARQTDRLPDAPLTSGLERVARASTRLSNLVDTFLCWARVDGGRFTPGNERTDVHTLVAGVVDEIVPQAQKKRVRYAIRAPRVLRAIDVDGRVARLLLIHVLERALQLTARGTIPIEIRPRDRGVDVVVTDHGIASWAEVRAELAPFDADSAPHLNGGTGSGLGLHVVSDIARAIGGGVHVEPPGRAITLHLADAR